MRRVAALAALLLTACASVPPRIVHTDGFCQEVSFSPDGRRIAYTVMKDNRWSVYVANREGTSAKSIGSADTDGMWSAWS